MSRKKAKPNGIQVPPQDDPSSVGQILVDMGLVTRGQLGRAVEMQERSSIEQLLGKLLVAEGHISNKQLDMALNAQAGLRSKKETDQAKAQAAIASENCSSVVLMSQALRRKSSTIRRATSEGHAAVTPAMLAKTGGDD
jgi:hypothetical protein